MLKPLCRGYLARIIHKLSAAAPDESARAAIRSGGLLNVLHEYACVALPSQTLPGRRLRRFATKVYELSGLAICFLGLSVLAQGDFQKGVSFYKQGQYDKAITEFEALVGENPEWEPGYRVLGDCYLKVSEYRKAADAFGRAIELQGDQWVSHYGLAVAQFNLGNHSDCAATLLRAERLASNPRDRYQLLKTRGAAYYNLGDFERAASDLEKAVSLQRGSFEDVLQLGISYLRLGNNTAARKYLDQALALDPESNEAQEFASQLRYQLALAAIDNGDYATAAEELQGFLEANPEDGDGWFNLGLAQLFAQNWDAAEQAFLNSSRLKEQHWQSFARLGFVYERTSQYEKSLEQYQKAYDINASSDLKESVERLQERIRRARNP